MCRRRWGTCIEVGESNQCERVSHAVPRCWSTPRQCAAGPSHTGQNTRHKCCPHPITVTLSPRHGLWSAPHQQAHQHATERNTEHECCSHPITVTLSCTRWSRVHHTQPAGPSRTLQRANTASCPHPITVTLSCRRGKPPKCTGSSPSQKDSSATAGLGADV